MSIDILFEYLEIVAIREAREREGVSHTGSARHEAIEV